jgi:hypothetical protein
MVADEQSAACACGLSREKKVQRIQAWNFENECGADDAVTKI